MDNKRPFPIASFSGGYVGNISPDQLKTNQASDLDNIAINPLGTGIRSRLGNSKYAGAFNSGAPIQGGAYFLQASGTSYIGGIAGNKFYDFANNIDRTGSVTITSGADNLWDLFTFQDNLIGFGGAITSPDAPISWGGSGNAAALGGTAPSAYGGLSANNRVFAFRTSANPSTIYWSSIGSASDFTGAGSGSAVIGSFSDNQSITAAIVLSTNYMLVFKQTSTYQMVISASPFPVYSLFPAVGCVGKKACVNIDGTVYWINQRGRMASTDGENYQEYPPNADNLWNSVQSSRYPYITGFRQKGSDYDWLVWLVSTSGSTNNVAIIWDLINQCWLRCTTGYKMNVAWTDNNVRVYVGNYVGNIYVLAFPATYADDSETSPGTITAYWRSGWINPSVADEVIQVRRATINFTTKASGNITFKYGFDFIPDSTTNTISQVATSTETLSSRQTAITGRGNYFQFLLQQSSSTIDMSISSLILRGKVYGQKKISAS